MKPKYICLFFLLIFLIIVYIFLQNGNTINRKFEKNIIEEFYKIENYKAKAKVTVYSNKNQTEYNMEIEEKIKENYSYQLIKMDGKNDEIEIVKKNDKIEIRNKVNNYEKIIEQSNNYEKNYLYLSNYICEKLKEEKNENEIILKKEDKLHKSEIYINKETGLPQKIEIKDNSQKNKVIIEYIEIEKI